MLTRIEHVLHDKIASDALRITQNSARGELGAQCWSGVFFFLSATLFYTAYILEFGSEQLGNVVGIGNSRWRTYRPSTLGHGSGRGESIHDRTDGGALAP